MAHCNTIFHQMLKLIPRHHFAKLEAEHGTGRKARSFTRWSQLVHLLSMQLTARVSLRDGVSSLKARIKSLYHLGVKPVARSTFADANNQRPASFFEALFGLMYRRCQPLAPKHKFKFKNKLYSLDATVVSLCLSLFPWAAFRRTKGGIKLHTLLDHDGYLPAFVAISPAREHEIKKARSLSLPKGSIVVEDMGYTDYAWYAQLTAQKIFFVTRQKRNARYEVLERRQVNKNQGLLSDQTIRLTGQSPGMPRSLAAHRLPGRRHRQALCLSHQPFQAGGQDHRRYLQRTLADRDLLPLHQAEPEDQGLHRQLGKRRADPNLCRPHRLSLALLSQVHVQLEHYFAKLHQDTTTQSFQDLHLAGTLRTPRDDS